MGGVTPPFRRAGEESIKQASSAKVTAPNIGGAFQQPERYVLGWTDPRAMYGTPGV
jgi:hypothetical protein